MNLPSTSSSRFHRSGLALAAGGTLLLVWLSLGVGIIGTDGDPANLMYGAVVTMIALGALITRFRTGGMAIAMVAAALVQGAITVVGLLRELGLPYSPPLELLAINGGFIAIWLTAGWLFRNASRTALKTRES